jgi:glucan phosphoethanolaminetransferase (alkaline phosphatase superfamily)
VDGATPPRYLTERAINVGRNHSFDRMILHYHQPHNPYAAKALEEDRELFEYETHFRLDPKKAWESYLADLRYVLDDVELLLDNIDAERVVISSDHGEAFGEYGIYGHPIGSLHPHVRTVPWAVTTASDKGTLIPDILRPFESEEASDRDVDETLEALGYKF